MKKARPNSQIVEELTEISFAMRRKDITGNVYELQSIFQKHPFLQVEKYVRISIHNQHVT